MSGSLERGYEGYGWPQSLATPAWHHSLFACKLSQDIQVAVARKAKHKLLESLEHGGSRTSRTESVHVMLALDACRVKIGAAAGLSPRHAASMSADSPVIESQQHGSALARKRHLHKESVDSGLPDDLSSDLAATQESKIT